MSRIFTENDKRDLFAGANNQIGISNGLEAIIQAAKSAVEIQLGEAIYATDKGIPTESTVWDGAPNLQQFEFFARRQISAVDGVTGIIQFEAEVVGDVLEYQATINTIFGEDTLNGFL